MNGGGLKVFSPDGCHCGFDCAPGSRNIYGRLPKGTLQSDDLLAANACGGRSSAQITWGAITWGANHQGANLLGCKPSGAQVLYFKCEVAKDKCL